MKYDPILCMMVDDSIKTTDVDPIKGKSYEIKGKKFKVLHADSNTVTVIDQNGIVLHLSPVLFKNAKALDAGGFSPGSKAKIVVENEGTQYETYSVEYGGQPLKRGFKTRKAAKNYAESQGLTTDGAIDEVIRSCDVGRGYDQLKHESKLLLGRAKEIATKLNRFNDDCRALRESERSDGSLSSEQRKEIEKLITEAFNFIGNNTEI